MKTYRVTRSVSAFLLGLCLFAGMAMGDAPVAVTAVSGHDGGNWPNTLGHLSDMVNALDNTIIATADTDTGMTTSADPTDPSVWTYSGGSWGQEWKANSVVDSTTSANSKIGWAMLDLGSVRLALANLFLWNVRSGSNTENVDTYNIYYAESPTAAMPGMPNSKTVIGDYDFSSGGWTLLNGSPLTLPQNTANNNTPQSTVALGGVSARYIGIEILTRGVGDVPTSGRVGLAQVEVTEKDDPTFIPSDLSVSGVAGDAATFNSQLWTDRTNADVTVYWGPTDGGTNASSWTNSAFVGNYSSAGESNHVISLTTNGLSASTTYYYTFMASNSTESKWIDPSESFLSSGAIVIENDGYTGENGYAALIGDLQSDNGSPATVTVYWGPTDGGAVAANWANTNTLSGTQTVGAVTSDTSGGLIFGMQYYYRYYATNATGDAWASSTASFYTGYPSPVAPTANLEAWYDAGVGVVVDGSGTVTNWSDRSGNGRHLTQAVGTPTVAANEVNGLPAINFDNDSEFLVMRPVNEYFSKETWLAFRSGQNNTFRGWGSPYGPEDRGNDNERSWMFQNGTAQFWNGEPPAAVEHNGTSIPSGGNVFSMSAQGSMSEFMVLRVVTGPNSGTLLRSYGIGTRNDQWAAGRYYTAEVLAYNSENSEADQAAIGGYLAQKYGISTLYPSMISISNLTFSSVTATSATFNASFKGESSLFDVYVYWGTSDGGDDPSAWGYTNFVQSFTNQTTATPVSFTTGELTQGTRYYYRFRAENGLTNIWADPVVEIQTLGEPTVVNAGATKTGFNGTATLSGNLTDGGFADVYVCWGPEDMGTGDTSVWENVEAVTNATFLAPFSAKASGVLFGRQYYYTCFATNVAGGDWSSVTNFVVGKGVYRSSGLRSYGYHINNDNLALNLDGNGGMMGGGDPTTFQNFYGQSILTTGPSNRGLNYDSAAEFQADGLVTLSDHFSVMFLGYFKPPSTGTWELRCTDKDDVSALWLDLDQDGVFESTVSGLGSDRGEQLMYNNNGTYYGSDLVADEYYMVALNFRENTGGDRIEYKVRGPGLSERTVKPSGDAAQDGMWFYGDELNVGVTNTGVTGIVPEQADLNGTLFGESSVYDVWVYWSTNDGGTSAAAWLAEGDSQYMGSFTNVASTALVHQITGLPSATTYYYNFYASNVAEEVWGDSYVFGSAGPPVVENTGGAVVGVGSAVLHGSLTEGGVGEVYLCWGASDGGTSTVGAWEHSAYLGTNYTGFAFSNQVTGVYYGQTYYYRCFATNALGTDWSDSATAFSPLMPLDESAPVPVTSGLELQLDASLITGVSDGSNLSQWLDESGNDHHTTAAVSDPSYAASVTGLNNRPAVYFDGNDGYQLGNLSAHFPTAVSMFVAVHIDNDTAYNIFSTRASNGWWRYNGNGNAYPDVFRSSRSDNYTAMPSDGPYVFEISSPAGNNNAWQMYEDGVSQGVNTSRNYSGGDTWGISYYGDGSYMKGWIAEILIYDRSLSAAERDEVGGYLEWKYGLDTSYATFVPPSASTLTNLPVSDVAPGQATLNAEIDFTNAIYHVTAYWSTNDYTTNAAGWVASASSAVVGSFTNVAQTISHDVLSGLESDTVYYYTFRGTNESDEIWADPSMSFSSAGPPTVTNSGATAMGIGTATLHGEITSGGGAEIYIVWGDDDAGTGSGTVAWDHVVSLGSQVQDVPFSTNITGAYFGVSYSYRVLASNVLGSAWSGVKTFTTLVPVGPYNYPTDGLLGMWTFDDDTAADESGNGHDGAWTGSPNYSADTPAGAGKSVDLNGNRGILPGGDENDFDVDTITIATWVKELPDGGWEPYIAKRGESNQGYQVRRRSNTDDITFTLRGTSATDDPDDISDRTHVVADNPTAWHHIVARYDGSRRQIIVNGDTVNLGLDLSDSGAIADTSYPLSFGGRHSGSGWENQANIWLDDIYVYDRALSDTEVAELYAIPGEAGQLPAIGIANTSPVSIGSTQAELAGTLDSTNSVFDVVLYWSTTSNSNAAAWIADSSKGSASAGSYTNVVGESVSGAATGLTGGTTYFYTLMASNAATNLWATPTVSFATAGAPAVGLGGGATGVDAVTATLRGELTDGSSANATFCWGPVDGGTNSTGDWEYTASVGLVSEGGIFSNVVSGLYYGIGYDYRVYVTNDAGQAWSSVSTFTTLAPEGGSAIPSGAKAYYSFDDSGDVPHDDTGNGYDGTLTDATYTAAGYQNGALALAADNGRMQYDSGIPLTANWTVSVWYEGLDTTSWRTMFRGSGHHHIIGNNGADDLGLYNGGFRDSGQNLTREDGVWRMLTAVGTPGQVDFYLDGQPYGSVSGYTMDSDVIAIGNYQGGGQRFADTIDEVYLYDRMLTPEEVEGLYEGNSALGIGITNTNPVPGSTSAELNGILNATQSVFTVHAYYSTNDNASIAAWTNDVGAQTAFASTFSNVMEHGVSVTATGLTSDTTYYCTLMAMNQATNIWASPNVSFVTLGAPVVDNAGGASDLGPFSATLNGTLTAGGSADAYIVWGSTDPAALSTGAWENVEAIGTVSKGVAFSNTISELDRSATYYYRCFVTNAAGGAWSSITNFTTPSAIYVTSFESPVVTGRSTTNPDEWVGAEGYGTGSDGLENEDSGTFTTPDGAQGAAVWGGNRSCLTSAESTFDDILVAGLTYTVTFNVAKPTDLTGQYRVQLLAIDAGDPRNYYNRGTVLQQVTGTATTSDMSEEVTLTYSTDASNANIGRQLAIRIMNDTKAVIDNLRFTDDGGGADVYPPALLYRYPSSGNAAMAIDYPLLLVFNEEVAASTGDILVRKASDDSIVETIAANSGQVSIDSNKVTITRSVDLDYNTAYYATIANTAFVDANANAYPGIAGNSGWTFATAVPEGSNVIFSSSAESPVVSGRVASAPDGWVKATGYGTGSGGMANTDYGTFTTPFGSQALTLWSGDRTDLTTSAASFDDTLVSGVVYTVTFNVANGLDIDFPARLPSLEPAYKVELVAYEAADDRANYNLGTVLASASGRALLSDLAAAADGFNFTATAAHTAHLGKQLAVRIQNEANEMVVVDNVKFANNVVGGGDVAPPALSYRYPLDNATTVTTNYPLLMIFNEDVAAGSGNIVLRKASDDSLLESIDVTSGQVTISNNHVAVTRNVALDRGVAYYVNIDSTAIEDTSGNAYPGISGSSGWNFSVMPADGDNEIYATSFESPSITGKVTTDPDGWIGGAGYGTGKDGLENVDSGTFRTPFGDQSAIVWGNSWSLLATAAATFDDTLVSGITYTVTFNVANTLDLDWPTPASETYRVELVAYDAGDTRDSQYQGSVLASASGSALLSDVASQGDGFTFTADGSNPHLGRQLAVRIKSSAGIGCVIDNLTFSDDTSGLDVYPPALSYRYPLADQTTMTVAYPLLMTFSEEIVKGSGNITIHRALDDSIYEAIDVTSNQVAVSSNEVTITRNRAFERGEAYYVKIDATAFTDLATNAYAGISTTDGWAFSTPVPDGAEVLYETSFESPVVSGRIDTAPAGWVRSTGYGTGNQGLENEDSGTFTTPFGSQAAILWGNNRSIMNTDSNTIEDVLTPGTFYTLSFNVAKNTDLDLGYIVQLVAYDRGEARDGSTDNPGGSVLAQASGTAYLSDMAAEANAVTFEASASHPDVGKVLGVRIRSRGTIDNLKLTYFAPRGTLFRFK